MKYIRLDNLKLFNISTNAIIANGDFRTVMATEYLQVEHFWQET